MDKKMEESMDLAKRLVNERDRLEKSRDQAESKLLVVERKYQDLLLELNHLKLTDKYQVSQLESDLKLKNFEVERLTALCSEAKERCESALKENDRLTEILDFLREKLANSLREKDEQMTTLLLKLQDKSFRLEVYDKLEADLDSVVMKAAALPNTQEADEILATFGYGASIPSSAKRRLEQCLSLARRVLKLEHRVSEQKTELFTSRDQYVTLKLELDAAKSAIQFSGRPTTELLNVIKKKDMEIGKLNDKVKALERSLETVTKSNFQLQAELTKGTNSTTTVFKNRNFNRFSSHSCLSSNQQVFLSSKISKESSDIVHIKKPLSFSKLSKKDCRY